MKIQWPRTIREWKEGLTAYKYVVLVLAVGVLLLLLPAGGEVPAEEPGVAAQSDPFDLEAFEDKLEQTLSRVEGAGEVRVVLTLDGGSRRILAQDQERDGTGGGASSTVTLGRGSGNQEVVPLQTLAPSFRGALVVCPGGADPRVCLALTEAVSVLTGLGTDSIAICGGTP